MDNTLELDNKLGNNWLGELFKKQYDLDTFIENNRGNKGTIYDKFNAFMVEAGEFMNEVNAFKYWSNKDINKERAYEEFVDGLHFLLTLGNLQWGLRNVSVLQNRLETFKVTHIYSKFDESARRRFVTKSNSIFLSSRLLVGVLDDYEDFFVLYMTLGFMIGLSIEDIIKEYIKKNKINYQRQINNY